MAEGSNDYKMAAMQEQINRLQDQNQQMQQALSQVANANLISDSLDRGFHNLMSELQPLRDLTPQREQLDADVADALSEMVEAMKGVTVTGGSLGIPEVSVPFIGQPRPVPPGKPGSGTPPVPVPGQPDPYKPDPYTTDPYRTDPNKTPEQPTKQQPPRRGYRP